MVMLELISTGTACPEFDRRMLEKLLAKEEEPCTRADELARRFGTSVLKIALLM